jgi:hypothetical protein
MVGIIALCLLAVSILSMGCTTSGRIQKMNERIKEFNNGVVLVQDVPFLITKLNFQRTIELKSTLDQGPIIMKNLPLATKMDLSTSKDAKEISLKVTVYENAESDAIVTFDKNELKVTSKNGLPLAIKEISGTFPEQEMEVWIELPLFSNVRKIKGRLSKFSIKDEESNRIEFEFK